MKAVLLLDIYGSNLELLSPNDKSKHKTVFGSLLSVITIILLLIYGTVKGLELVGTE